VLDGGDTEVHLGGSRLTRFMESVERVTAQPAADAEPSGAAGRTAAEPTADEGAARNRRGVVDASRDGNPWQPLLAFGQALLNEMAQSPEPIPDRPSGGLVRRDPQTGERYLHLPVPDQDKIVRLLDALRDVLVGQ
jgi:hypothetical protein